MVGYILGFFVGSWRGFGGFCVDLTPKSPPRRPGTPKIIRKWSQLGAKIELEWVLMLKTVTNPKLLKNQVK